MKLKMIQSIEIIRKEMDPDCEHINVIHTPNGDTCTDCGLVLIDEIFEYEVPIANDDPHSVGRAIKPEPFDYYDQMSKLDLPPVICKNVCGQIEKLKRKTHVRRSTYIKNLFIMIYIAYNQEKIPFNVNALSEKLEMDSKQTRDAIKMSSKGLISSKEKQSVCINDPFVFFKEVAKSFEKQYKFPDSQYSKIEEFIKFLMEKNCMLMNESPKGLAVVIYKMFLDRNNIKIKNFNQETGRTQLYIRARENIINETCNHALSSS